MTGSNHVWLLTTTLCLSTGLSGCAIDGAPRNDDSREPAAEIPTDSPPPDAIPAAIEGGSEAAGYPEAALLNMALKNGQQAICSGAVIAPRVVLTAGHCIVGVAKWDVVAPYAGDQSASSLHGITYDYTDTTNMVNPDQHDVGLVILDSPIALESYPTVADVPVAFGETVVSVGRIDDGVSSYDSLFVSPAIPVENGAEVGHPFAYLSEQVIQPGDSGGPTLIPGSHHIVGVNSGAGEDIQVLARVDLVFDWIQEEIAMTGDGPVQQPPGEDPPTEQPPGEPPPGTDDCGGIPTGGACVGSIMTFCAAGSLVEIDCGVFGLGCGDAGGGPTCQ